MQFKTIDSSKITWYEMDGDEGCNVRTFCADGDGILQVIEYAHGRFELVDQMDVVKVWTDTPLAEVLENAQSYLAATYHQIFEDAMHWNDEPTTEDLREQMNHAHGYGHLNEGDHNA